MAQANSQIRVRHFVVPPTVCSFGVQGIDVEIVDGMVSTSNAVISAACKEHGFAEVTDAKQVKAARKRMADRLEADVTQAALAANKSEDQARLEAKIALREAGYGEVDDEPEDEGEPEEAAPKPKASKPRARASA